MNRSIYSIDNQISFYITQVESPNTDAGYSQYDFDPVTLMDFISLSNP